MGLMIHSLCELPADVGLYQRDFYVYLLDYGWEESLSAEMYRYFPRMAEAASRHGAVVLQGTVGHHFADEVFSWHHVNGSNAKDLLPAVLVTTKHPQAFREGCWKTDEPGDRLLLIPLRGVCRSPSDVAQLFEQIFSDIQQKKRLSQFEVAKRMVAGRDGAILDAVVLKRNPTEAGVELSVALNFLNNKDQSRTGYTHRFALPSQVDVAIVTILPEEYEAVKRRLKNVRRDPGGKDQPNQYAWVVGEIEAAHGDIYQVVLAMTLHPGNSSGSLAIAKTVARWRPRYALLVGIAGGLPRDHLGLGDVVVSKQIVSYEYGKVEHNVFNPRPDFVYQIDGPLLRNALSFDGTSATNWRSGLGRRPGSDRGKPKVLVGIVGSGEKVIDDRTSTFFAAVEKLFPKLLAVEMEGAGAAAAIQEARDEGKVVGFLMIRGISDMPPAEPTEPKKSSRGTKKDAPMVSDRDKWKSYAANAAASFAVSFVSQAWPLPPLSSEPHSDTAAEGGLLLHVWSLLESELQDALALAYNAARRSGSRMIQTRLLFAAIRRLRPKSMDGLLDSLPSDTLPPPLDGELDTAKLLLRESPSLSGCVADSLRYIGQHPPLGRKVTSSDIFVDIARYGTGSSVARLRSQGIGPNEIDRLVEENGIQVLKHRPSPGA